MSIVYTGKKICFKGDSITAGTALGSSAATDRWTYKLCQLLGAVEENNGISGTTITPNVPYRVALDLSTIPAKTSDYAVLSIAFGVNDLENSVNIIDYIQAETNAIDNAISKGWQPAEIMLVTIYWITSQIGRNSDVPRFRDALINLAAQRGTMICDMYTSFAAASNRAAMMVDSYHSNAAGNTFQANIAQTAFNTVPAPLPSGDPFLKEN